jgi:hypothetical protein
MKRIAVIALTLLAALSRNAAAQGDAMPLSDVLLVKDGAPRAVIVLEAPPADTNAAVQANYLEKVRKPAEELHDYIKKMSGAELPILVEGAPLPDPEACAVYIGHTRAAAKAGLTIPAGFNPAIRPEAFEEEGYILRTQGKSLFAGGNADGSYRGTVYAVYALLETLGCRWYFPGEWGEVVPERKTIAVPVLDVAKKPDFAVRQIWISGWVPMSGAERKLYTQWQLRVGFSQGSFYPSVGDGFLASLLPPDDYFEKHPEYFAMNEQGARQAHKMASGKYYERTSMLCLSNPDVFTESVRNLKLAFAGEKKLGNASAAGFGISPPDGVPYCYCPDCKKASQNFKYPQYVHRTAQSEECFGFAARLAREFPDKWASTMAYALREFPPQGVDLPDNVMVMYAPIANDIMHPHDSPLWRHTEFLSMLRQFRRQTPHLTLYDYNPGFLSGMFVPERDAENMAVNMPIYKAIGLKGFNREGRKAFMQTWLSYYINAKLMWDCKADVEALKKEFYTTFFGPDAGPHVQAWWDGCARRLVESDLQAHEDFVVNHLYDLPFVQGLKKHVDAALAAPATPVQKGRLEAFALIADHLLAYAEMNDAEKRLDYAAAAAAAGRTTEDKEKLYALYPFFIQLDKAPRKPRSYFGEGRKVKYDQLLAMGNGTTGTLVAPLPLEMKFARDPYNQGIPMEWYAPGFDDSAWGVRSTYLLWDQQEPFEDAAGHDYDGYGWYRGEFTLDAAFAGKPLRFWCGGLSNEGWVWINGRYAGRKAHALWWMHPHDFELDVGALAKPGRNTIAIRVLSDSELGGLYRRGFFYSPREAVP